MLYCALLLIACTEKKHVVQRTQMDREDSVCKYGKKYARPARKSITFPAQSVSNSYKVAEIHKAVPDSFENNTKKEWLYLYYYVDEIRDYDEDDDSTFTVKEDKLQYKLKDLIFVDINGDGLLDIIHYPKYYRAIMFDHDYYDLFIQIKKGKYQLQHFNGYIIDIDFASDNSLVSMKTFQNFCCDDNHTFFFSYLFDKSTNNLVLQRTDTVLTCQFH